MNILEMGGSVLNTYKYLIETISNSGNPAEVRDKVLNDLGKKRVVFEAGGSIMKLISPFIVEPLIIINKELRQEENIEDIINVNIDLFASIYTQAFQVMTNLYGLDAKYAIDMLTKKGGVTLDLVNLDKIGAEDITSLVSLEDNSFLPIKKETIEHISLEATKMDRKKEKERNAKAKVVDNRDLYGIVTKEITLSINIKETESLNIDKDTVDASGKTIKNKGTDKKVYKMVVELPITIRANIIYTEYNNIANMLEVNSDAKSFLNRIEDYRSGAISLSELVFASDIVKQYKTNKLKDKDDLVNLLESRATSANLKLFSKGTVGLTKYFAMLIINSKDKSRLEYILRGKIDKSKYREKLFEQSKSMMLTVVDTDWERVSIYLQDINGKTDISYKKLTKRNKKDDSSELLKAVFANRPPVF